MTNELLSAVDEGRFDELFIRNLGWNTPTHGSLRVDDGFGKTFEITQIASYRGMGIWSCNALPSLDSQRIIDSEVAKKTLERLIIYSDGERQEWRWPRSTRRGKPGPPTLVPHRHAVGQPNPSLAERLQLIKIPADGQMTVPELLDLMREAFDREAETASKQAARLMGSLYEKLETAGMGEQESSIFLARMLFLMFGDDTGMWRKSLFHDFLAESTKPDGSDLRQRLSEAFEAADTDAKHRRSDLPKALVALPYINGGIFAEELRMPELDSAFRKALIEACRFDWGQISPAVFGSMFQTVKSKEARRHLGEHYTTEENILKTIEPLFLDELRERLDAAWDDRKALSKLHHEIGEMKFLDPACGCGNFLIVAYRELRALELALLIRQRDLAAEAGDRKAMQLAVDATQNLKVSIEQFHGIEIEAWPARIAETAMFLVDHQANQRMDHELGTAPTRLPLEVSSHIHLGNALTLSWRSLLPKGDEVRIMGNPPFAGRYTRTKSMGEELQAAFGGASGSGNLDFVAAWFARAADYLEGTRGRAAFVSTNSISQGEQPGVIWTYLKSRGMQIDFAYRTFPWSNAEPGEAAVHCVITGISATPGCSRTKRLWVEPDKFGNAQEGLVEHINGYLSSGPDVLLLSRKSPLVAGIPVMRFGSMPNDGGWLSRISAEEQESMAADPVASRYLRPLLGAQELIQGTKRWCLWLESASKSDIRSSRELRSRIEAVGRARISSKRAATRALAAVPHLFGEIRQPRSGYIAVPRVSSEQRSYVPISFENPETVATDSLLTVECDELWVFSILTSSSFNVWNRAVSGRLKSDTRISAEITYNNFPWPDLTLEDKDLLGSLGRQVLDVRSLTPDRTLAELYDPTKMPSALLAAHIDLDTAVLDRYGLPQEASEPVILARLFERYSRLLQGDALTSS